MKFKITDTDACGIILTFSFRMKAMTKMKWLYLAYLL